MKRQKIKERLEKSFRILWLVIFFAGLTLNAFVSPLSLVKAAAFTPGDVVVYRVGSGTGSLINTGSPVFLDEYTPAGTLVQSIALPTTASGSNKQLVASGTATSEGLLSRSADGQYLILTGYGSDIPAGSSLSGTNGATVPRTVGRVDAAGNIDTSTALSDFASGNNPRSVTSSNGTDLWVAGGAGGVRYATLGSTTSTDLTTSATFANVRQLNIFNGQLYASSGTGTNSFKGVETVGTGLPTTGAQTVTRLPGLTDALNPSGYSFYLADLTNAVAGPDTLYVADDSTTALQKFSLVSGTWTSNGTVGTSSDAYRGLTATVSGTTVTLYATGNGTKLVSLVDSSGYNGAFSGTPTPLATAAANTAFRGVALAPESASPTAPTITTDPSSQTINNNTAATLSVVANGTAPLTYQWYQGNSGNISQPISGATSATYTTPALSGPNTYNYWVRVTNTQGHDDSATATITVTAPAPLGVTVSPTAPTIVTGSSVTLTAAPSGGYGTIHYQWYQGSASDPGNATTIGGATSSTYNTGALTATTQFFVAVTDDNITPQLSNTVTVTVTAAPRIHDIQGAAHISPLVTTINDTTFSDGANVTNVPGIVTALRSNSFYMQDPEPDSDPNTSEGILVFTSSAPSVHIGDSVTVSGQITEYRSSINDLTTTEISNSPTITLVSPAHALPDPIVIGTGGRTPPTQVIKTGGNGSSIETPGNTFDAATNGIDFWESLEGMRIQLNGAKVVGPTDYFSGATSTNNCTTGNCEIPVVPNGIAGSGTFTARGGIEIAPGDFNPERIILNNIVRLPTGTGTATTPLTFPAASVGDSFNGPIVGVIDYSFDNYKLFPSVALPALVSGNLQPETLSYAAPTGDQLTVATFNVENLAPGDAQSKYDALAAIVKNNLKTPDIIAVEEIQDNNGATNDAVVAADQTYGKLIQAITAAGGPTYVYKQIDPVDDQDGGQPGGNIRQGFLYRTDRGLNFVDKPGGTSTTNNTVLTVNGKPQLQFSPGRLSPADSAFTSSRKPLAAQFSYNNQTLFVIANHFNSKGGDQPLFGRFQPPTLTSEVQRQQQATIVHNFVDQILTIDPNANVVVAGDLNDFQFSNPLATLKNAGTPARQLHDLIETLPTNEQYTYVYQGNSQVLDHILVSNHLFNSNIQYDVVHVNSEFYNQISDHDPGEVRFDLSPVVKANDDAYSVTLNTTLNKTATDGVLSNDDGGASTIVNHTNPAHGTLTLNNDGSFSYKPDNGYTGTDTFQYTTTNAVQLYTTNLPPLATVGGVNILGGAYGSSLTPVPGSTTEFYGLTDRGPNVDGPGGIKVEPIPGFTPAIGRFKFENGKAVLEGDPITLKAANGTPYTGQVSTDVNTGETIQDINGNVLLKSPTGYDPEGLVALPDGTFWVSDEYGPFITHFDATGLQLERLSPFNNTLPGELKFRVPNRGMEGLTVTPDGTTLVGMMQSALQQPDYGDPATNDPKKNTLVRIVTYNLSGHALHEYVYLLDNPSSNKTASSEITALTNTTFLVDERDGDFLSASHPAAYKKLWKIDITGATDIGPSANVSGGIYDSTKGGLVFNNTSLDTLVKGQNTADATTTLVGKGITPVSKTLFLDIGNLLSTLDPQWRFFSHDKLEGVAVLDGGNKVVISNDNDFGIDGVTNGSAPYQLHAKTSPTTGKQDDGEYLVVDMAKLPVSVTSTSTATVTFTVGGFPVTISSNVTDNGTGQAGTISGAIQQAGGQPAVITINPGVTVTLGGSITLPSGTIIKGSYDVNGVQPNVAAGRATPTARIVAANSSVGTAFTLADSSNISGVVITGFSDYAIKITGDNNTIAYNWIGTSDGSTPDGTGGGIFLDTGAVGNSLGVEGTPLSGNLTFNNNSAKGAIYASSQSVTRMYYTWIGLSSNGAPSGQHNGPQVRIVEGAKVIMGPGNRVQA